MARRQTKSRATIPVNESKSDRFVRVVTPRVSKAVKAIRVIGFCTGTNYEHTPKQINQIIEVLRDAMSQLTDRFAAKKPEQEEFDFS